jgi:transposase-like protein
VRLGKSVGYAEASRRLGIPESSLSNWVKLDRAGKLGSSASITATPRSVKELEAENDRLRRELASAKVDNDILKSGGVLCQGVTVKYAWIEAQAGWQPIARLCKVLGVSRSGFLQWRHREPSDRERANRPLDARVAVIHAEGKQGYGRIRVTRTLRQSGMRVGAERVRRSLLRQNLRSVYRRKYRITTVHTRLQAEVRLIFDGACGPSLICDAGYHGYPHAGDLAQYLEQGRDGIDVRDGRDSARAVFGAIHVNLPHTAEIRAVTLCKGMSANSSPWKPTVCALCATVELEMSGGLYGDPHGFEILTKCAMFDNARSG